MGFNFGAFVGGFSKQLVETFEAEEERQFEMEKIAETEAMRQRAAASSRRRAEQAATEQMMGALSMFYGPEVAAQIAARGEIAVNFAMEAGQRAAERNINPDTLWNLPGIDGDMSNPETQRNLDNIISAADAPEATISAGAAGAPQQTISIGGFGLNNEVYSSVFGDPDEFAGSYGAALAEIDQRIARLTFRNPDDPQIAELESQKQMYLEDVREYAEAQSIDTGETRLFTPTQLNTVTNGELRRAYIRNNFEVGINGEIVNRTDGNEHRSYIAEAQAARSLEATYGYLNDPLIVNKVNELYDSAQENLIAYGNAVRFNRGARLREEDGVDGNVFQQNMRQGVYSPGDVVRVMTADGIPRYVIYTGTPMPMNIDSEGRPVPFLFLN